MPREESIDLAKDGGLKGKGVLLPEPWGRTLVALLSALAVVVAVYWDTIRDLVQSWAANDTFNHCFLVVPGTVLLLWRRRALIEGCEPQPTFLGGAAIFLAGAVWAVFASISVAVGQQIALVSLILSLVWLFLGTNAFRLVLFPLGLLYFAVPVGEGLIPWLQDMTAMGTVTGLRLIGVPVFLDGRVLHVPGGSWEVAESCAGIRYVIPALMLGYLFAGMTYRFWPKRVAFLVASFLVPIAGNSVRAIVIVVLALVSGYKLAMDVDHLVYGWVIFGLIEFPLFWVGFRWRDDLSRARPAASPAESGDSAVPVGAERQLKKAGPSFTRLAVLCMYGAGLSAAPAVVMQGADYQRVSIGIGAPSWPVVSAPFVAHNGDLEEWRPFHQGALAEATRTFELDGQRVHLFTAYYGAPRSGARLMQFENRIVGTNDGHVLAEKRKVVVLDRLSISVKTYRIEMKTGRRFLVWRWYWVDGEFTADPYRVIARELVARLTGHPPANAIFEAGTICLERCEDAEGVLQAFFDHTHGWQEAVALTFGDAANPIGGRETR
ncbi:MAG: EpsI family protein [Nitrospira sp.]|jgi:exosortase A|nr:EpsI family protein [Nitrospira sp.]